jgi:hypothetical protein
MEEITYTPGHVADHSCFWTWLPITHSPQHGTDHSHPLISRAHIFTFINIGDRLEHKCAYITYLLRPTAIFFSRFRWNLQGMWRMVKTELHFFCFSLKWKVTKIFVIKFFRVFLTVYVYSDTKVDQILTVYRKQSVESQSVEIFVLPLTVFELEAF